MRHGVIGGTVRALGRALGSTARALLGPSPEQVQQLVESAAARIRAEQALAAARAPHGIVDAADVIGLLVERCRPLGSALLPYVSPFLDQVADFASRASRAEAALAEARAHLSDLEVRHALDIEALSDKATKAENEARFQMEAREASTKIHLEAEAELESQVAQLRVEKNDAYAQRNELVALLARMALTYGLPAGTREHPAEDTAWEADWRAIVMVDLPTGQVSWHFHDSERPLLAGLPVYPGVWDGHSTATKRDRVRHAFAGAMAQTTSRTMESHVEAGGALGNRVGTRGEA